MIVLRQLAALLFVLAGRALAGDDEGTADKSGQIVVDPSGGDLGSGDGTDGSLGLGDTDYTSVTIKTPNGDVKIVIPQPQAPGFPIETFQSVGYLTNSSSLSFIALGDWGIDPTIKPAPASDWGIAEQQQVSDQMAQLAKNVSIDLVINTGDNFYQNGINSVKSSRWNTTFENVYKIPASWYSVLGNHDYLGNAADGSDRGTLSQINYTTASISKRWVMPWYYYTKLFIVGNQHSNFSVQFVFIDTMSLLGWGEGGCQWDRAGDMPDFCKGDTIPKQEDQLQWLTDTLETSVADWLFVVGHHPIYSVGEHGMKNYPLGSENPDFSNLMTSLLPKYNVTAYLFGHDHLNQVLGIDSSANYYTQSYGYMGLFGLGSAGKLNGVIEGDETKLQQMYSKSAELKFVTKTPGFGVVNVTKNHFTFNIIDASGKVLYNETYSRTRWIDLEEVEKETEKITDRERKEKYGLTGAQIAIVVCLSIAIACIAAYVMYRRAFVGGQFNPGARVAKSKNDHTITVEKDRGATVVMMKKPANTATAPPQVIPQLPKKQLDSI